jgi:rhodanese-related sulfurtransferase
MTAEVKEIDVRQAWEKLRTHQACQIIDVRESDEYANKHVAGSLSMPLSSLNKQLASIDANKEILLLCGLGKRAHKAAEIFIESGITNVEVIDGGLKAWVEAGCPTE